MNRQPDIFAVPMDVAARLHDSGPLGREMRLQFANELRKMGAPTGTLVHATDPHGDVAAVVTI